MQPYTRVLTGIVLGLCACQSLAPPDAGATQRARERLILFEATTIARSMARDRDRVVATIELQGTEIAAMQRSNAIILVTVRAGDASAPRSRAAAGQGPPTTPGRRWFAKTGISRFINFQDDCVVSPQISFTSDADVIYVTLRAWNVSAGLQLSVQWWHEGQPVHSEAWVLPSDRSESCYWFSLTPELATFLPGSWSVQLYADGAALESPQSFTIREPDLMMDG